jgi:hypothetical protein
MEVNPTLWTPGPGCHVTRDVPLLRKADTVTLRDMDSVTRHARGHVRMSRTTSRALSSRWPGELSRIVPHVPLSTAAGRALHCKDEKTCTPWGLKTKATPVASPQIERIWPVNRAGTVAAFRKPVRRRDRGPVFKALRALMGPPSDPSFQTALVEMSPIGVHI